MANLFTNAVDITPGTAGVWVNIDVSAYVPAGATGVILQVVSSGNNILWGLRKLGSTDNRTQYMSFASSTWGYIGINSNRVFQGYIGGTGLQFKLLGYFTSEGVFFTNGYNKAPSTTDSWVTIDCSAQIPAGAKFAVVELSALGESVGLRPTGSTDNRIITINRYAFALVGLDANRTFEVYRPASTYTLYLIGYLTLGTPKTNGADVSLTSTGAYVNIDRSGDADAANAIGVLVEKAGETNSYALRKNGSTDDFYVYGSHVWGVVGLDANKVLQGKIANLNVDFYIMGYLEAEPPPTWEYVGNVTLTLTPQGIYGFPITKEYEGNVLLTLLPQGVYHQEWNYIGDVQISLLPQGQYSYLLGWEYVGNVQLSLLPQGDYFAVIGRGAIPVPYVLRYPNPRNGQTNVPVGNPIKFIIKSDMLGINIDTVKVKVTDSWGINIYDKTSPYFKYSGKKSRYEVEVKPPQPWQYEEGVQAEIEAEDLAGTPGVVYEYVP